MAIKAAIAMTSISIILLVIYGSDAALGGGTGTGFLPFDHKIRGIGLGIPSVVLPIIAYVISKNNSSKILGILIITSGLLTVIGSAAFLVLQGQPVDETQNRSAEFAPVIALGALITGI